MQARDELCQMEKENEKSGDRIQTMRSVSINRIVRKTQDKLTGDTRLLKG